MSLFRAPARIIAGLALCLAAAVVTSCETLIENRIPDMPVSGNITGHGVWNTFGVSAYGQSRDFILYPGVRQPAGFPYVSASATGFGGVLLISGVDPFTSETMPVAYDLSCPVERSQTVRVRVNPENYEAVCPQCGSRYDVVERGGAPLSGPALDGKYRLKNYRVIYAGDIQGGYSIVNRY